MQLEENIANLSNGSLEKSVSFKTHKLFQEIKDRLKDMVGSLKVKTFRLHV